MDHNNDDLMKRFEDRFVSDMVKVTEDYNKQIVVRTTCPCRMDGCNYCVATKTECNPTASCKRILKG